LGNRRTELVNLKLPKFEITFDKKLNDSLSNMGLEECFDVDRANFDQMGKTMSGDNLYISFVRQKAKIIVDEEGTEAAAVTEVIMACGAAITEEAQKPREVYFNEPFVYMIMDMDRELPLFIGILDNPVS
ncbi:MAG: serpin, partial [Lachnospiraceae bacterium]|nr:serpin [Lachnospiraceae bacterium]